MSLHVFFITWILFSCKILYLTFLYGGFFKSKHWKKLFSKVISSKKNTFNFWGSGSDFIKQSGIKIQYLLIVGFCQKPGSNLDSDEGFLMIWSGSSKNRPGSATLLLFALYSIVLCFCLNTWWRKFVFFLYPLPQRLHPRKKHSIVV